MTLEQTVGCLGRLEGTESCLLDLGLAQVSHFMEALSLASHIPSLQVGCFIGLEEADE